MSSKSRKRRASHPTTTTSTSTTTRQASAKKAAPEPSAPNRSTRLWLLVGGALALIIVIGVFGILFANTPSAPTTYSTEGRISFVRRTDDSKTNLYVVNADGTNQQQATKDLSIEGVNTWSPDGRQLLVQAGIDNISTVVRMDVGPDNKSSNAVQLTADVKADSAFPTWSPDGTLIAFQSKREGGDFQVFIMNPDGNNKRRISDGKGYAGQPAWSPDGKSVVYVQGDNSNTGTAKELYIAQLEGAAPTKLTSTGKDLSRPQWSPDGKQIVFTQSLGDRNRAIYSIDNEGKSVPKVLVEQGFNSSPQFSPDGNTLVFYSVVGTTGSDIFTIPSTGGPLTSLTSLSPEDYQPAWSPDGKRLTWASKNGIEFKVVVAGTDGSNPKPVSQGEGSDYQPAWGAPVK